MVNSGRGSGRGAWRGSSRGGYGSNQRGSGGNGHGVSGRGSRGQGRGRWPTSNHLRGGHSQGSLVRGEHHLSARGRGNLGFRPAEEVERLDMVMSAERGGLRTINRSVGGGQQENIYVNLGEQGGTGGAAFMGVSPGFNDPNAYTVVDTVLDRTRHSNPYDPFTIMVVSHGHVDRRNDQSTEKVMSSDALMWDGTPGEAVGSRIEDLDRVDTPAQAPTQSRGITSKREAARARKNDMRKQQQQQQQQGQGQTNFIPPHSRADYEIQRAHLQRFTEWLAAEGQKRQDELNRKFVEDARTEFEKRWPQFVAEQQAITAQQARQRQHQRTDLSLPPSRAHYESRGTQT